MAQELLFTSAPKGLKPGSSGPCIVQMSDSMPPLLMQRLEAISVHRVVGDGQEPIPSLSHVLVDMNGMRRHVVSRVAHAGTDHAGRPNHLAHHLVLHGEELGLAGPAWLVQQPVFKTAWDGRVAYLEGEAWLPEGPTQPVHLCANWKTVAGDAGWAGVVAEAALVPSPKPVWVIHRRNVPVLALLDEVVSVVPPRERWKITFSTQFTQPLPSAGCTIRFCLAGTDAAHAALHAEALVLDLSSPGRLERSGGLVAVARSGRAAAASQAPVATTVAPVALEPERRGKRVVPMLETKAPTRIDPAQRQASMPAIDVGGDSMDQGPATSTTRSSRGLREVPRLPWVVALLVTAWASLATIKIITTEAPTPNTGPIVQITPSDAERDGLRARVDELEVQLRSANESKAALEMRVGELDQRASSDRAEIIELESRLAAAKGTDRPSIPGAEPKVDTAAAPSAAAKMDTSLKRPQAAGGEQRLGAVGGAAISVEWPTGTDVDLAWRDDALLRRSTGKRLAGLRLIGGTATWTWDALELPALNGEALESILDAVTAAAIMVDGRQAATRIDPRTLTLQVQRKALISKASDLRTTLHLPWSGWITVHSQDGPQTVEPGRAAAVNVSDELGPRGVLTVELAGRGDRVTFAFTPDAALDQDATRRRLAEATQDNEFIALVREHDRLVREQPAKQRKNIGTSKSREAYEAYLAKHFLIAEKISLFRAQGLDDLKDQLERDSTAAAADVEAATSAVERGDALRARWPKAFAEIAPRGGQGFVLLRMEAVGP